MFLKTNFSRQCIKLPFNTELDLKQFGAAFRGQMPSAECHICCFLTSQQSPTRPSFQSPPNYKVGVLRTTDKSRVELIRVLIFVSNEGLSFDARTLCLHKTNGAHVAGIYHVSSTCHRLALGSIPPDDSPANSPPINTDWVQAVSEKKNETLLHHWSVGLINSWNHLHLGWHWKSRLDLSYGHCVALNAKG